MKAKLTDRLIQKRKAPDAGREEIFDTQVQGFGIRIGQKERAFFFIRRVNGEKTRFSLGLYPAMTLTEARSHALDVLSRIKRGEDPREQVRRSKEIAVREAENTFGKIAERFLTEYASGKKKPLRPQTVKGYRWALTGEPTASWKKRPLVTITDRDVIRVVDAYEAKKQFASARLFRAYVHRFFRWAVEKRLIDKNPAGNIPLASAPSDFKRKRVLSVLELRQVLAAAEKLPDPARAFIKVLVLTAQRRGETSRVKWSELSLEGEAPLWRIPADNAKNHLAHDVPLSREIVEILGDMPRLGEFVFTTHGKSALSNFSKIKARLDELIAAESKANRADHEPMADWRLHDLRRSAATGMADIGIAPHIIEEILNHVSGAKAGVAGLYNRSRYDEERRRALITWAAHVSIRDHGSNVVRLRVEA
jgi:integrase